MVPLADLRTFLAQKKSSYLRWPYNNPLFVYIRLSMLGNY